MIEAAGQESRSIRQTVGAPPDLPEFYSRSNFSAATPEARASLAKISSVRVYRPDEFIYMQHDYADYLHFVRSGHVRLSCLMEDGSAVLFGFLAPGEIFGELGVIEGGQHCETATSVGTSSIVSIPAGAFRSLASTFPALDVALGRTVARRYRSFIEITRSLRFKTLEARLAHAIVRVTDSLSLSFQYEGRPVRGIGSFVTQADLGLMARGARGNVNRLLKTWERSGLIAIQGRCILVLDRQGLISLTLEDGI